jgi:hypothetical protein
MRFDFRLILKISLSACLVAVPAWLRAESPALPKPIVLPPGLHETLPLNPSVSYVGDAVRIVDCPRDEDEPFGLCSNELYGGLAMWDSPISGNVDIQFYPPVFNNIGQPVSHFQITHPGNLAGQNTVMKAPQNYEKRVKDIFILDSLSRVSTGDVNLTTGEVLNLNYQILVSNSWYADLVKVNPKLKPPDFSFPGAYGSGQIVFTPRPDGLLDLTFTGSTFLPLGLDVLGDAIRMPLPFCGPLVNCFGIQAQGSSLHPHIYWTTTTPIFDSCGASCPEVSENSVKVFQGHGYYQSFGDHFTVNVPQLGGTGNGRSHLQGRYQLQFGPRAGNRVPLYISALAPAGLMVPIPTLPPPLSTFRIKQFAHTEFLRFPSGLIYVTADPILVEDGFDIGVGSLDLTSGQEIAGMVYRGLPAQDLFFTIINLNLTTIPLSTFRFRGPVYLLKGQNGESIFGYNGSYFTPFDGFQFPSPDYTKPDQSHLSGPGSVLNPFMRFQGVSVPETPHITKSGSGDHLVSSINQVFSYNYSMSCDPAVPTGQFDYTNFDLTHYGGTFHLENVASVSCTNSKYSWSAPGDYDTISFVGYGTWSPDTTNGRHVVAVHISEQPDTPLYVSIQVDGNLSKVHLKPSEDTIP